MSRARLLAEVQGSPPSARRSGRCCRARRPPSAAAATHHWRDRHRQELARPDHPRGQLALGGAVRRAERSRDPRDPARIRAVRLRARRVHRCPAVEARALPGRPPRYVVPRRGGAVAAGAPGQLLTVLEDGSVRRLGATRSEPVDVCVISATNEDLQAAVRAKRFREDLYHRLAVITLPLPPLRELGDDIRPPGHARADARVCEVLPTAQDPEPGRAGRDEGVSLARQRARAQQHHRAGGAPMPDRGESRPPSRPWRPAPPMHAAEGPTAGRHRRMGAPAPERRARPDRMEHLADGGDPRDTPATRCAPGSRGTACTRRGLSDGSPQPVGRASRR